jgi:4-nitrophenyl phosphatase
MTDSSMTDPGPGPARDGPARDGPARDGPAFSEPPAAGHSPVPPEVRERLRAVRGFVFDLDGTLVLGDRRNRGLRPLPGAIEIIRWARQRELPIAAFTNGTTKTPQELAVVLRDIGFDLPDEAVLTPAVSAADVLNRRGHQRVLVLGHEAVAAPLREAGLDVVLPGDVVPGEVVPGDGGLPGEAKPAADAVLVGWYPEFSMAALETACQAVWAGAAVYSASQSMFFATAQGRAIGTSRAISAMIKSLTSCRVYVVGKPSLAALRTAARRLGLRPSELAVVGDDPELEVPMAHRGHATAIAVASGLATVDSFDHLPPEIRPHLYLNGVDELLSICQSLDL